MLPLSLQDSPHLQIYVMTVKCHDVDMTRQVSIRCRIAQVKA